MLSRRLRKKIKKAAFEEWRVLGFWNTQTVLIYSGVLEKHFQNKPKSVLILNWKAHR